MSYVLLSSVKLFEREKLVAPILLRFKKGARSDLLMTSWGSRGVPGVLDTLDLGWLPGCFPFFLPALPLSPSPTRSLWTWVMGLNCVLW